MEYSILPLLVDDQLQVRELLMDHWGSNQVVSRERIHYADQLHGFKAVSLEGTANSRYGRLIGVVTYSIVRQACEIVTIDSLVPQAGIGSGLIQAVLVTARAAGCRRLWLITSNDNTPALRFYQKRGFRLVAVYPGAIDQARHQKPEIPLLGIDGIPIHDEIELEINLLI